MRRQLLVAAVTVVGIGLVPVGAMARPASPQPAPAATPTPHQVAAAVYARMTTAQRIGQLFMAGVPSTGATRAELDVLRKARIGNLILTTDTAKSHASVRAVSSSLVAGLNFAGVEPFISTDQEGGEVQRLTGKGFTAMPTALQQGAMKPSALRVAGTTWGHQLATAGVTLDLAPVADTVPAKHAKANQPIGRFDREFGHTPAVVASHVVAFLRGMNSAGVDVTLKHFPGLGRATGNTDTQVNVTDPTTRHDRFLKPFSEGVAAGAQFVMVSSATYPNIDPKHLACFSKIIMTSMLRGDLHFGGVVISDSLGTVAMKGTPIAARAINFFSAGGTMALDTSLAQIPAMVQAVVAKIATSTSFAAKVRAATMSVLLAKAKAMLIPPSTQPAHIVTSTTTGAWSLGPVPLRASRST
jgi:beta-N-acetylhexosaminidase